MPIQAPLSKRKARQIKKPFLPPRHQRIQLNYVGDEMRAASYISEGQSLFVANRRGAAGQIPVSRQ